MARDASSGRFVEGTVRVDVHEDAIERMVVSPDTRVMLLSAAQPVVNAAKSRAPRATGRGAEGIHAEVVLDGHELAALVSWEQEEFYMYWHEKGSRMLPARPFLVPALRAAAS